MDLNIPQSKEKHRLAQRKYRSLNTDKCNAATKSWCERNQHRKTKYNKEYYQNNKERMNAACKNWSKHNREKRRIMNLRLKYNLTLEQFEHMLLSQKNKCAICGGILKEGRGCCVDHDHITGKVRELLCQQCNGMLGLAKDNVFILRNGADYLEKWNDGNGYKTDHPVS